MIGDTLKRILLIFCTTYFSIFSISQRTIADSLKNLLANTSVDSVRVFLMYKISDEYSMSAPDTAMQFARKALKLAQETGFKKGEARSLTRIGNILAGTGYDFSKALESHFASLVISEGINDRVGMAATYNNIARIYTEQGTSENFKKAINYYLKTKEIFVSLNDEQNLCIVLLNIGDNYEKMDQLDSALLYQTMAYKLAVKIEDTDNIGAILVNLGYIQLEKNNTAAAFKNFREGIKYLEAIEDNQSLADAWYSLSVCFEKTGQSDSSVYYAKKSLEYGMNGTFQLAILNASKQLSKLYEAENKFKEALEYKKISDSMASGIFHIEKTEKIQNLNLSEQIRQQEMQEAKELAEKERSNNLQMIAITVFIITFFVILIILSQKKINPRAIDVLSVLGLLLVFEFIMIFIHPFIGDLTHHTPVYMLIIYVVIAGILGPVHHYLTKWLKLKLAHRTDKSKHNNKSEQKAESVPPQKVYAPAEIKSKETKPVINKPTESKEIKPEIPTPPKPDENNKK